MNQRSGFLAILLLAGVSAVAGCSAGGPASIDPGQTYPQVSEVRRKSPNLSGLVVFTATFMDQTYPSEGTLVRHTGYTLYDEKGRRMFYVRNYLGMLDTEPTRVPLDPGRYLVLLDKPGDRSAVYWVTVVEDRVTEVVLD